MRGLSFPWRFCSGRLVRFFHYRFFFLAVTANETELFFIVCGTVYAGAFFNCRSPFGCPCIWLEICTLMGFSSRSHRRCEVESGNLADGTGGGGADFSVPVVVYGFRCPYELAATRRLSSLDRHAVETGSEKRRPSRVCSSGR